MKNKPYRHILYLSLLAMLCFTSACDTTKSASSDSNASMTSQTLYLMLRKEPNVKVIGSEQSATVYINNIQGVSGGGRGEPMFVLNGNPIGYSYNQAFQMVDGKEIESVKVLKSTVATVQYGERAANGAIVIYTKNQK